MEAYHRKLKVLPLLMCLVLAAILLVATPVSADDGQPVDPPAVEESTAPPPTDSPAPVEGDAPPVVEASDPVEETPAAEESAPPMVEGTSPAEEPAPAAEVETPPAEEPTVQELTTAVAESDVVLVDPAGEPVPMATRDTSLGVVKGDPYFDVGATRYSFTAADCNPDSEDPEPCPGGINAIQAALDYMVTHNLTPTDRKLYIESVDDDDSVADYVGDVAVLGNAPGVKGLLALVGLGATPEDVYLNGSISVTNMPAGFTISNMRVLNQGVYTDPAAIYFSNNKGTIKLVDVDARASGTDGIGIVVTQHYGNVEFNRVRAVNSGYSGAVIDVWLSTGTVKITNSEFSANLLDVDDGWTDLDTWDNGGSPQQDPNYGGLRVWPASGAVTLNGVTANDNLGTGAIFHAYNSAVSIKNSVFIGNDVNPGAGLLPSGNGALIYGNTVILDHILATDNQSTGIEVNYNTSLTVNNIYSSSNDLTGFYGVGCVEAGDFDPYCDNTGAGTVTIKTSNFLDNGGPGLSITTKGAITIVDVFSNNNGGDGFFLENENAPTPMAVTLTNVYGENDLHGIRIETRGAVTMTNFTARNNGVDGLNIESTGSAAVTLTNTGAMFNTTSGNGGYGYFIRTAGPVTVINTDSFDNGDTGAHIDNINALIAAPVTIKVNVPGATFSTLSQNGNLGLFIVSHGVVTILDVGVDENGGSGAIISNLPATPAAPGVAVVISNGTFLGNQNIDGNGHGLSINSKGAITLLNITATGNDGVGALLTNDTGTAGITINAGTNLGNSFLANGDSGLRILTKGAVLITNVNASDNGGFGAQIDNLAGTGSVTIKAAGTWGANMDVNDISTWGNSFSRNDLGGLDITTKGLVLVTFNHASENDDSGIRIDSEEGPGTVTLMGNANHRGDVYNNGDLDGDSGIIITAKGIITLTSVTAFGNFSYGAYLDNLTGTGGVTLTDALFDSNYDGLLINTKGAVLWKTGSASNNFNTGASIYNDTSIAPYKSVTVSNVLTDNNGHVGLEIHSKGAILLTNVESNGNSVNNYMIEYGEQWFDNMSGEQTWFFNGLTGENVTIEVNSPNFNPSIFVYDSNFNLIDSVNGAGGNALLALPTLTLDDTYRIVLMTDMGWSGQAYDISIYEGGVAPIFDTFTSDANGMYLDNSTGVNAPVTLTNTYRPWNSNNSGTDLYILSSGVVSLTRMDLNDSGSDGLFINNTFPDVAIPGVILTDVYFFSNDANGAYIRTDGSVVVKGSFVGGNALSGLDINNTGGTAPVTLTTVDVNTSGDEGILIASKGLVTFTGVGSNLNGDNGIDINTLAAVSFKDVDASDNSGYGAYIVTPSMVTILQPATGLNNFVGNSSDGLYIDAGGKVTLGFVRASNNLGNGLFVDNSGNTLGTAPVVLTNITALDNSLDGVYINTTSAITVTTAITSGNDGYGLRVFQVAGPLLKPVVTITDILAEANGEDGIYIDVLGNIIANKLNASGNGGVAGANLLNNLGTGTITILNSKGANFFGFNDGVGLNIVSNNLVTVTGVEALGNSADGIVILNNNLAQIPAAVTVNSVFTRNNGFSGLSIKSWGVATVNTSWSVGNGRDGISIVTENNVFVNNSGSINNNWAGIFVDTDTPDHGVQDPKLYIVKLTNSTWFGNLRLPFFPTDTNLMVDGNVVIV